MVHRGFPPRGGIRFHDVTFRYPGSERVALEQFSLTIPASKITALVGVNGAGKSTLTKLLCRFYDPQSGHITLDGIDLRDVALADLRRLITILFQQPVQYHTTAAENITFGDLSAQPTQADIERAAQAAGAEAPIKRLPQEYDTVLGKWFGGAELSVGEWQRVALARAFLRQAPIIILDEPTSAMDHNMEQRFVEEMRRFAAGRTLLLVPLLGLQQISFAFLQPVARTALNQRVPSRDRAAWLSGQSMLARLAFSLVLGIGSWEQALDSALPGTYAALGWIAAGLALLFLVWAPRTADA